MAAAYAALAASLFEARSQRCQQLPGGMGNRDDFRAVEKRAIAGHFPIVFLDLFIQVRDAPEGRSDPGAGMKAGDLDA
ncbi:hypothetical protein D3C84_1073870 [compost metagenome]